MSGWRGGWQGEREKGRHGGRYWDEVPLTYCADHYEVHVRECSLDDIVEIDTFKDLHASTARMRGSVWYMA